MEFTLTTPALLFSLLSLLMLAYTNRFLGIASLVRALHADYRKTGDVSLREQIRNLRRRLKLIKHMQINGTMSILACSISMILFFYGDATLAQVAFLISLLTLIISLSISLWEVAISVQALDLHLKDMEKH